MDDTDLVQLVTATGERVAHPDYTSTMSGAELRACYRDMTLVRRLDTEATALQRQGELGLWAPSLGQEAAQVGSGRALGPDDYAFPTYREHGVAWTRGVDPLGILSMFRGVDFGAWDPREHNLALYTIVIGNQTLHAVGYAMGIVRDAREAAAVAYFGDGASSEGDVNEAFVWASAQHLPIVFVCQNNGWAISESVVHQTSVPLARRAAGFGFPGVRVDGNDVVAVHAVMTKALTDAREGHGPTLIEAVTYRMGPHTTSDDPTRYREDSDVDGWRDRDPIARLRALLVAECHADVAFFTDVDAEADALAARIRREVIAMPEPDPSVLFDHVYAGPHRLLDAERAEFEAASEADA